MNKRPAIFYGWWIVAIGTVTVLLGGGLIWNGFSVFFIPLVEEFGWSRGQLSLAMSISSLVWVSGPVVGAIVDKYGSRRIMVAGSVICGGSFALLGFTTSIWYFYAMYFAATVGLLGIVDIPVVAAVTNWFEKKRGLAMGIVISGWGMGGLVIMPAAAFLIAAVGWRNAYVVLGLGMLLILVPLIGAAFRHRPSEMGLYPDGDAISGGAAAPGEGHNSQAEISFRQAIKTMNFWLLVLAISFSILALGSIITHAVPFFQDIGLSPQTAANIMAAAAGVSVPGGLLVGYLADRYSAKRILIAAMLLEAGGIAVLLVTNSLAMALIFILPFGFAMGAPFTLLPLFIARFFGLSSMGAIYGGVWAFVAMAMALGPPATGYIFDVTGSYSPAFALFIGVTLLAALLVSLMKLPPEPAPEA